MQFLNDFINKTADQFYTRVSEITQLHSREKELRVENRQLEEKIKVLILQHESNKNWSAEKDDLITKLYEARSYDKMKKLLETYYES